MALKHEEELAGQLVKGQQAKGRCCAEGPPEGEKERFSWFAAVCGVEAQEERAFYSNLFY